MSGSGGHDTVLLRERVRVQAVFGSERSVDYL